MATTNLTNCSKTVILNQSFGGKDNNYDDNTKIKYSNGTTEEQKLRNMIKSDKILTKIYEERSNTDHNNTDTSKDKSQLTNIFRPNRLEKRENKTTENDPEWNVIWHNVYKFIVLHMFVLYGLYLILTLKICWKTTLFAYFCYMLGGFGVTAGSHRLWSHRSYKANLPLRIFLMLCHTSMFENNIYHWCREHRTHHKYTDTKADPHNAKRGVFYSHIGWLMLRKSKNVINAGRTIDFSDILEDPVVKFQINYYYPLVALLTFAIPIFVPWYFWNEHLWYSFVMCLTRFMCGLNGTFLVNSFAHAFGSKPYDKSIKSTENKLVSILAFGEGWHNYHHVFPWDYKAAELGTYGLNFTTCFLDLMAKIGWATELKTASEKLIRKRILRTGDGSHTNMQDLLKEDNLTKDFKVNVTDNIWGWGDKDMNEEEKEDIVNYNYINSF